MAAGRGCRSPASPKCHVLGDVKKVSRPYRVLQGYADNGELHQPKEQTMTEAKTTNEANQTEAASGTRRPNAHTSKSVAHFEEQLRKARLKLAEAKVEQAKQADRGKRIRERVIGRIVLELIEDGKIDPSVIALLRDEVKKSCRQASQILAFAETIFK
jgi:hypothetical protein